MTVDVARAAELMEASSPETILEWTYRTFRRVAIVASFQAESCVLIHMASAITARPEVVTLDTGRLPEETHRIIERVQRRYPIRLRVQMPDPEEVMQLVAEHGPNPFYDSLELRRRCCDIRKSRPLARALKGFDAWLTGVRRDQIETRRKTPVVQRDRLRGGIIKVAPLAGWTRERVWSYVSEHDLDYHDLYDRGYRSIGCAPCTRPVRPEEHERAGRWWWEDSAVKECGLHWTESGAVRAGGIER